VKFSEFIGNQPASLALRKGIADSRLPNSILLHGPRGVGKYSLALATAQTLNCLSQRIIGGLPDACGICANCTRIAAAEDLDARLTEAVAAREDLRDVDKRETRIMVQTHPDVLVIPPDPPQLLIKIGQVRNLISSIYYRPAEAPRRVYIFTGSAFMKEAANSLLKVLEEPPEYAHIFLLAENIGDLLPTIRSRCTKIHVGPMAPADIEQLLSDRHADWKPDERKLVSRLSEGAPGRALTFDLATYVAGRADALTLLRSAMTAEDHSAIFRLTETYRAGAEGQQKTQTLLRTLYSLFEDILLLQSGAADRVRNIDIAAQLQKFAESVSFTWIESAVNGLHQVESGMRRNLLRSLSLDAFATGLTPTADASPQIS
jgi:DNA polymerase-3 subunit delta'